MIRVRAYKKDRKRKYWVTVIFGTKRYHLSTEEAGALQKNLMLTLVFFNQERRETK
jgi:hypothetical protein